MSISGVLLVLLTVSATARAAAQIDGPAVTDIRIGGDTVSIYAVEGPYSATESRIARFARRTGAWIAGDSSIRDVRSDVPQHQRPVRLTRDLELAGDKPIAHSGGFSTYAVVDSAGHRYALRVPMGAVERWRLLLTRDSTRILWWDDPPQLCARPTMWLADSHAIWFACTQASALSAVLRFDRLRHQTTAVTGPGVVSTAIVGIAETRRALWVAGRADSGSGLPDGDSGLFRLDLATGAWSRLDRHPVAIAAVRDSLWIATADGIALYDERADRWTEWSFHARLIVDTTDDGRGSEVIGVHERFDLAPGGPPPDEQRNRLRIALAARLVNDPWVVSPQWDPSADSVLALVRSIPGPHLDSALADPNAVLEHALADPMLVELATSHWFAVDSSLDMWDLDVARAIAILGDRRYRGLLRLIWERNASGSDQPWLAAGLARLGDTSGTAALRETVARSPNWYEIALAASALAELGDTTAAAPLVRRLEELSAADDQHAPALLFRALGEVATPAQWQATIRRMAGAESFRRALLDRFYSFTLDSLVRLDPVTHAAALAVVHEALATPKAPSKFAAADLAVVCRNAAAVPYLLSMLNASAEDYRIAQVTLTQLSGIDSAPAWLHPTAAQRRAVQQFWERWWQTASTTFVPVPTSSGRSALLRWRLRALRVTPGS